MNQKKDIRQELSRIKSFYRENDASDEYKNQYLPFLPMPLGYHQQLISVFAKSMYKAGYTDLKGLTILDVGCGEGRFLGDLIGFGAEGQLMCGADLMTYRLKEAKKRYPSINFMCTDGIRFPFSDAQFDLISQNVVFSSIGSEELRQRIVKEMLRVLKTGGYIWYWDIFNTVQEAGREPLVLSEIFPGIPIQSEFASWLPLPSEVIPKRRWKYTVGWFADFFKANPTHMAALIGPKPESS